MKNFCASAASPALWLLAFICALYPFNALDLELFGACVALMFLWSFNALARGIAGGWSISRAPVLIIALAFWILVASSLFWSEIKPVTLMSVCLFSVFPLTFFTLALCPDEGFLRKAAIVLGPIFFVLGVWAVIQYFFLNEYFWGQAQHPLKDPSSLGALLSLGFFSALGWLAYAEKKTHKIFAFLLAFVLVSGIFATAARGPFFAMIPGLVMFVWFLWPRVKEAKKSFLVLLVLALSMGAAMQLNTSDNNKRIGSRVLSTITLQDADISNQRTKLWSSTIELIKRNPILGTGFGTYYLYLPEVKDQSYVAAAYHAHNDPLEFWAELGVLGPILFYAFVFAALQRTIAALKNLGPGKDKERIIITTAFSALAAMVLQSHVNFNLYNLSILMIAGFIVSAWYFYTTRALDEKTELAYFPEKSPKIVNLALIAAPFVMLGGMFLSNIAGEHYTSKARDAMFQHDMENFVNYANKSGYVSNDTNYRSYILAVNVPLTLLEVGKSTHDLEARKKLYEQARGYMERVLEINPRVETAYYYLARAQELAGRDAVPEETPTVEELYLKSLTLDPMHLSARLALYDLYVKEGREKSELFAVLEPAQNMYFNTPLAMRFYQELSKLHMESGNYVKARETMAKMAAFHKRLEFSKKRINTTPVQALLRADPTQ